jgi:hypothetical protein
MFIAELARKSRHQAESRVHDLGQSIASIRSAF